MNVSKIPPLSAYDDRLFPLSAIGALNMILFTNGESAACGMVKSSMSGGKALIFGEPADRAHTYYHYQSCLEAITRSALTSCA